MRKITIDKINGETVVTINTGKVELITAYTINANIYLTGTKIVVVKDVIPFLEFTFDEILNPFTATNLEEYKEVMIAKKFFLHTTSDGGAHHGGGSSIVNWNDIQGKPATYPPDTHTHVVNWADIQGKPTSMPTTAHTHNISEVDGLQGVLDGKANTTHTHTIQQVTGLQVALDNKANVNHSHNWNDIQGKPTSFPVEQHTHTFLSLTDVPNAYFREDGAMRVCPTINKNNTALEWFNLDNLMVRWNNITNLPNDLKGLSSHLEIDDNYTLLQSNTGKDVYLKGDNRQVIITNDLQARYHQTITFRGNNGSITNPQNVIVEGLPHNVTFPIQMEKDYVVRFIKLDDGILRIEGDLV